MSSTCFGHSYVHHQELATILLNYHIGRIVLGSMCVGISVCLGWSSIRVAGCFRRTDMTKVIGALCDYSNESQRCVCLGSTSDQVAALQRVRTTKYFSGVFMKFDIRYMKTSTLHFYRQI